MSSRTDEQLDKLNKRFGSSDAASREILNYKGLQQLRDRIRKTYHYVAGLPEYAAATDQFRQYRTNKKIAERQEALLASQQTQLDTMSREMRLQREAREREELLRAGAAAAPYRRPPAYAYVEPA